MRKLSGYKGVYAEWTDAQRAALYMRMITWPSAVFEHEHITWKKVKVSKNTWLDSIFKSLPYLWLIRLRPCLYVSVFIWKSNFFITDTTSVHTYPKKTLTKTFPKRSPEWNFLKTLRTHYQFQSTPRNIRNFFKLADGRFPFCLLYLDLFLTYLLVFNQI